MVINRLPFSIQTRIFRQRMNGLKLLIKVLAPFTSKPEVFVGPGSSLLLCDAIASTGVKKLLLVTDEVLVRIGLIAPLQQRLAEQGVSVSLYDGVLPDPSVGEIERGLEQLHRDGCTAVLAVGGGSSIDAAKLIATRATNPRSIESMMGILKVKQLPLPIFALPTTAGTGSEVSIGAVVSDPANKRKIPVIDMKLMPRLVALDGSLMTGLPPSVTSATAMDALTHAVEAYVSAIATPESDQAALEAVSLIMKHLPRVMADGSDVTSRQHMAWAAYRAGIALSEGGLGYVHAIAHTFGGHYHVPHGLANAIVLPHVLEFSKTACVERLADLARVSGLDAGERDEVLADKFIAHIRQLKQDCGIPEQLAALKRSDFPAIIEAALEEAHNTYAVPRYMDARGCAAILTGMLVQNG